MTSTKRSILAGSVLLTLVLAVGADLGLVRLGARQDVGHGQKAEAVASVSVHVKSCA